VHATLPATCREAVEFHLRGTLHPIEESRYVSQTSSAGTNSGAALDWKKKLAESEAPRLQFVIRYPPHGLLIYRNGQYSNRQSSHERSKLEGTAPAHRNVPIRRERRVHRFEYDCDSTSMRPAPSRPPRWLPILPGPARQAKKRETITSNARGPLACGGVLCGLMLLGNSLGRRTRVTEQSALSFKNSVSSPVEL